LTPPETTLTATPPALGNVAEARFEFTSDRAATFQCKVDDGAATPCSSPFTTTVDEGSHLFEVVGVSITGVADATPATFTWDVDLTPPDTTISQAPPALDNSVDVTFEFAATELATFACALDGGTATPCTSPFAVTGLADGPHTLAITATDPAGNVEPAPATHAWTIDTSTPDTEIDTGPTGVVSATAATFTFSSPDAGAGASFACALDGGSFAPCTSPRALTNLAQGAHTFQVRVSDATGNTDPTPAQRTWTVDTVAPTVTITGGPTGPTNDNTPTFTFTTAGNPTAVTCRIGTGAFAACASSFTPAALADGAATFEVRAVDAAGNAGTATRAFTVDTVAPTVVITGGPTGPTSDTTPTFTFTTAGAPVTTECRIDASGFAPCTASFTPAALADGARTFEVRVVDAAGNSGAATRAFVIDTGAPTVTITGGPAGPTNDNTPTFTFTTAGSPTVTECRIGTAAFAACTSPFTPVTAVADGAATFEVRVADAAGNASSATRAFTVDTVPPTATITGGPTGPTNDTTPTFTFTTAGSPTVTQCRIGTAAFVACTGSYTPAALGQGATTFEVRVADAAGNASSATRAFTIDTVAPTATITGGPTGLTNDNTPTFTFTTSGAPTTTQCRIGLAAFVTCASPYTPAAVAEGARTFEVRVTDAAGNAASATRNFTVDTTPPTVNVTNGPTSSPGGNETFTFTREAGSTTRCRSYRFNQPGGAYTSCTSPVSWPMQPPPPGAVSAQWTFEVLATDAAGNMRSAFWNYSTFTIL
ncbi:MAG TPA: Ig-like domain-containing protein, partial [Kofleriaceae bacterium]|nr:Ig-like domain-containing protein [Kofleriaceae bacterium]